MEVKAAAGKWVFLLAYVDLLLSEYSGKGVGNQLMYEHFEPLNLCSLIQDIEIELHC